MTILSKVSLGGNQLIPVGYRQVFTIEEVDLNVGLLYKHESEDRWTPRVGRATYYPFAPGYSYIQKICATSIDNANECATRVIPDGFHKVKTLQEVNPLLPLWTKREDSAQWCTRDHSDHELSFHPNITYIQQDRLPDNPNKEHND